MTESIRGFAFPFLLTGFLTLAAAAFLVVALPAHPKVHEAHATPPPEVEARTPHATALLEPQFSATTAGIPAADEGHVPAAPLRLLLNRLFLAAIVIHFGFSLAFGVFEVVWTLFLTSLGATIGWVVATR